MRIEYRRHRPVYFAEIKDFPYAYTLSPQARKELEEHLEEKYKKFLKQKKYIAMCIAKGEKPEEW